MLRSSLLLLIAFGLVTVLTALPGAGPAASTAQAAAPKEVHLQFQFRPERGSSTVRYAAIHCVGDKASGAGWLTRRAKRACQVARRQVKILARKAPPKELSCLTAVYGKQVASVVGTIGARDISRSFSRHDSCWESEWDAIAGLLPHVD